MMRASASDRGLIHGCIEACAKARDGRGRWRHREALCRALLPGTTPTIAAMVADAAQALGEFIASAGKRT